jgi:hypothetical protein
MALLPDGSIAIAQMTPARLIRISPSGDPAASIEIGDAEADEEGLCFLDDVMSRGDHLAITARKLIRTDGGFETRKYLATIGWDGRERARLYQLTMPETSPERFVERDEYFVSRGHWALGPDGRVYAAPDRDRYAISVYDPRGDLLHVIERDYRPRRRTPEEKSRVGDGLVAIINGERIRPEIVAEETPPCIQEMHVTTANELWVSHSSSRDGQPAGILETFDVFDASGHFLRQVAIACDGDPDQDRLFILENDRFVLVRGYSDSVRAMTGVGAGSDEGAEAVEIVYYAAWRG